MARNISSISDFYCHLREKRVNLRFVSEPIMIFAIPTRRLSEFRGTNVQVRPSPVRWQSHARRNDERSNEPPQMPPACNNDKPNVGEAAFKNTRVQMRVQSVSNVSVVCRRRRRREKHDVVLMRFDSRAFFSLASLQCLGLSLHISSPCCAAFSSRTIASTWTRSIMCDRTGRGAPCSGSASRRTWTGGLRGECIFSGVA